VALDEGLEAGGHFRHSPCRSAGGSRRGCLSRRHGKSV
jgi:hypothetical protein